MNRKKKRTKRRAQDRFAKNVRLLKKRYPNLWRLIQASTATMQVGKVGDGKPTNKERIHQSRFLFYGDDDPTEIARKEVKDLHFEPYDTVFLIGMGLGYLPKEAIKSGNGNPQIVIIEPSLQVLMDALKENDLSLLLKNDRTSLFVGDNVSFAQVIAEFSERIPLGRNKVIVHPNYETAFGNSVLAIRQELVERIRAVRDNWFTTKKHGRRMFENTIANLPSLFAGTPMKNLRGRFNGIPAICVAAGPSLDEALSDLKELQAHSLIIACDSAVGALLKAGIRPHIVVTIDIFETNIDKLRPHFEALRDTLLIFSIESNPDNVRLYLGPKRVVVSAYSKLLLAWIDPALNLDSQLPAMTSVSHMAIFLAMALGADPIVFVGMDLAYSKGKSHSYGSAFYNSLDSQKLVTTSGNNGLMIPSSPQFVADKLLIERVISKSRRQFINTSVNGAFINGTEIRPLAELAGFVGFNGMPEVGRILNEINWANTAEPAKAVSLLEQVVEQFESFRSECKNRRRALLKEIDALIQCTSNGIDPLKLNSYLHAFDRFENERLVFTQMIKDIMLDDLHDILKKREVLETRKRKGPVKPDELGLLVDHYKVFENGMLLQCTLLNQAIQFLKGCSDSCKTDTHKKAREKRHYQLASIYEEKGEIWQAAREYSQLRRKFPADAKPFLQLVKLFIKSSHWGAAQELITKNGPQFSDHPEMKTLEAEIRAGIDGIFDKIKSEWMQGNMHTTRKLMNQFLVLRPNDLQINALEKVIRELDTEFSSDWERKSREKKAPPDMSARLQQVLPQVKAGQIEKGIGILEGLIEDFPNEESALREQIGDIRMMSKDLKGAAWNYIQALKMDPMNIGLKTKIERARSMQ